MFKQMRVWMTVLCVVALAGCGGGSSSGGGGGAGAESATPWVGTWRLVSESGAPVSGNLTLNPTSFTQMIVSAGGICAWTGSVSGATATNLTVTVDTGDGPPYCMEAVGRAASPAWMVSDDGNELTLDYRGAIELGTLQVWERT